MFLHGSTLQPTQKHEIMQGRMSYGTLTACHQFACNKLACYDMTIIWSENAPLRRVYLRHPTQENWLALERSGFFMTADNFGFVMDALH